jgi:acyl-CoA synthetase (NDP forming)
MSLEVDSSENVVANGALGALLAPRSIAVLGASRIPGKIGYIVLSNLLSGAYTGRVIPVNPSADEILGQKCIPKLQGSGEHPDLAVVVVPAPHVMAVVEDAIAAGVRALAVITAGFREAGPRRRAAGGRAE